MEIIIYHPNGLKLKHSITGKIYTFNENTEMLKYDNEKFTVIQQSQSRLF